MDNNYGNLRLKLFSSFIILSVIVLAVTSLAYLFIYKAEKKLEEFSQINLQQLISSHGVSSSIARTQSNLRKLVIATQTNRPHEVNEAKTFIIDQKASLDTILNKWQKIIIPDEKAGEPLQKSGKAMQNLHIKFFIGKINEYYLLIDTFMNAYNKKDFKKANHIFEKNIEPLYKEIIRLSDGLKAHAEEDATYDLNKVRAEILLGTIMSFFLVIIVIAFSMLFAYRLSKSIINQLIRLLKKIKEGENKLIHMARHDSLTNLPNRLLFNEELDRVLSKAERHKEIFALLVVDVDHFKSINDTYGHRVGDILLQKIAERQRSVLRAESIVSRFGGDEFSVILMDIKTPQDAGVVAKKLIRTLGRPYIIEGHKIKSSISIGIANYPISAKNAVALLKSADIALYHAKNMGRNNYQFFTEDIGNLHQEKLYLENYLRDAIDKNQMSMVYQPVISATDKKLIGMEALIRWEHPILGPIFPETFIAVAEERGMIIPIGAWALSQACFEFSKICTPNHCDLKLFLNISPFQLVPDFLEELTDTLAKTGLRPQQLEFEITETAIMTSLIGSEKILNALQALGVKIAIDDFGTGYSSLARLRSLPINTLKIDRSFVQYVTENLNDRAIIISILGLAKSFNMNVIAEGVETQEQMDFLVENGCTSLQGFYISKPLTLHEMQDFIERWQP